MRTVILSLVLLFAATGVAAAQEYVVVVNAGADAASLDRSAVADIFMKRKSGWTPVDQAKGSPVRASFSKAVLSRDVGAVEAYWQQQIFAGKDVPPAVKASDADVLAHVRATPDGIGYVQAGTALGDGVKAVPVN